MPELVATYGFCTSANAMLEFVVATAFVVHHTVIVPMHTAMLAIVSRTVLCTHVVAVRGASVVPAAVRIA